MCEHLPDDRADLLERCLRLEEALGIAMEHVYYWHDRATNPQAQLCAWLDEQVERYRMERAIRPPLDPYWSERARGQID